VYIISACLWRELLLSETKCLLIAANHGAPFTKCTLTVDRNAYRMRLDGVAYFSYVLITVFVPLKLWCRRRAGGWGNIGLDDYLTVVALAIANGFFWICMIGMSITPRPRSLQVLTQHYRHATHAWSAHPRIARSNDDRRISENDLCWPNFLHARHNGQQICRISVLLATLFCQDENDHLGCRRSLCSMVHCDCRLLLCMLRYTY
jgi:hypothetical protein